MARGLSFPSESSKVIIYLGYMRPLMFVYKDVFIEYWLFIFLVYITISQSFAGTYKVYID